MNLLKIFHTKRNTARLINICSNLIDDYENSNLIPSCKNDLIELISKRLANAQEEISNWNDYKTDYIRIAHTMLVHGAFDLLTSGRYHLYRGVLHPISCADNLMKVYRFSLNYAVVTKQITEEQKESELEYLDKCISEVG